jgi:hypothetical protein
MQSEQLKVFSSFFGNLVGINRVLGKADEAVLPGKSAAPERARGA